MEVARSAPETFTETYRRKTPLPLRQLVEETRRRDAPHPLLDTKIYAQLQSSSIIRAEPSVLHFSGFKLRKDYCQVLKLINISSDVINIHILPTQTKYFHTKYSKKHRLVPGLSYTVKVQFCPDEWRYFYDCIRVHCKGEENLLVPVHAYPVIDDLHIPSHVSLPAAPLGQSVRHVIPLSCGCPVDFEFQVYVIQPHPAFSVQPLSGVIPADGEVEVTVAFTPLQYGTSQVTLRLVVSQFNSKPYVCTVSGVSAPGLAPVSLQDGGAGSAERLSAEGTRPPPVSLIQPLTKAKLRSIRTPEKAKAVRRQRGDDVHPSLQSKVDLFTPAGVAKMLIQPTDKMSSKDLREAMSQSTLGQQTRQMKDAFFESKVRQDVQEERANYLRWQVHLGKDPLSAQTKVQILEEREVAYYEYMVRKGEARKERDFARSQPMLSSRRVLRNTGQAPAALPTFRVYSSSQLEVRHRALRLFQQAARKAAIRCRMNNRLVSLRQLTHRMKRQPGASPAEDERPDLLRISPERVFPFAFPVFSLPNQADELAPTALGAVPSGTSDVFIKPHTPFFSLKVPQHYKLMGYQPVCVYEAMSNYIAPTLPRMLRTGAQDELLPTLRRPPSPRPPRPWPPRPEEAELEEIFPRLSFRAPPALLQPPSAHPLRIFNPDPGLHAFRPTPRYLESDPEFHLCPLPRYPVQSRVVGVRTPTTQKTFLDRADVIRGVMTWKKFPSAALAALSSTPTLTGNWALRMSDTFSDDLLPATAPPALDRLPEDMLEELLDGPYESAGVSFTPEMVRAEFPVADVPSRPPREESSKEDGREWRAHEERSPPPHANSLGSKVTARLHDLQVTAKMTPP